MRPKELDLDLDAMDADGLAAGNSSAGATLTLDGVLTSGGTFTAADGFARKIVILDLGADNQSGATYTITGTDQDGEAITDDVVGPTASATVESSKYFKTISSMTIASPVAGSTVDVGTADEGSSATIPINFYNHEAATVSVDVTGTINFTVQETFDLVLANGPTNALWVDVSALASKTADTTSQISIHATAVRVVVNSHSAAAELQAVIIQSNPY